MSDNNDKLTPITEQSIDAQAAQWLIRLRCDSCSDTDLAAHKAWLDANLMHRKAYIRLAALWDTLGDFAEKPEVIMARDKAKTISNATILPMLEPQEAKPKATPPAQNSQKKHWLPSSIAASVAAVIILAGIVSQLKWNVSDQSDIYQTRLGEQKTIQLADGSELLLDTETILHTDFSAEQRRIVLQQGRAYFDVAHDKARPFIVQAGSGRVTALGTAFVVRKERQDVIVTLLEGKVAVTQSNSGIEAELQASAPPVVRELEVGQQLAYSEQGLSNAHAVDIPRVTAWQQGRLIYEDHSLVEVINDLNRYSKRKILLGDKAMETIKITGVFKTGDNRKAIQALAAYFGMKVITDDQGSLVLVSDTVEHAGPDESRDRSI